MRQTTAPSATRRALPALIAAASLAGFATFAPPARAAEPPIKIGVIGEEGAVAGASLTKAAQMAADDINAKGGVNGRKIEVITYDDHSSAADAVRAFQRAANQDHVIAVIVSYISEVALAVEPWAARLHMPDDHARRGQQPDLQARPRRLRPLQIHVPRLAHLGRHCADRSATPRRTSLVEAVAHEEPR